MIIGLPIAFVNLIFLLIWMQLYFVGFKLVVIHFAAVK
jgi:hypothetical protein